MKLSTRDVVVKASASKVRGYKDYKLTDRRNGTLLESLSEVTSADARRMARMLQRDINAERKISRHNPAKRISLKNFTGTITKNPNGTVSIKGRKK
jgi:hypothetical protein